MTKELLQDTNSVVKQRSSAACIKEGFRFITSHFRSLFHSAWVPVLVTALLMTVYFLFFIEMMVIPMPTDVSIGTMVIMYVSYVLYSLSGLLLTGRLFMLFKEFRDTGRVPRLKLTSGWKQTLKMAGRAFIFQIWIILLASPGTQLFSIIGQWLPKPQSLTGLGFMTAGLIVVAIIAFISLIPLMYTFYKYVLDGGSFMKMVGKSYARGARHRGKIVAVGILSGILVAVILGFVLLPMMIVSGAFTQSVIGILQGDESGVPSYFPWLMRITYLVSMIASVLVSIYCYSSMLYVYGSIEAQENERENYIIQQETNEQTTT